MRGLRHLGAATMGAALLLGLTTTATAQAEPAESVTCTGGDAQMSIQPGLAFGDEPQAVTVEGSTTGCSSPPSGDVTGARLSLSFSGAGSCLPSQGIPAAQMMGAVTWTGGEEQVTSNVVGTAKLTANGLQTEGTVTSGAFKGKTFRAVASATVEGTETALTAACMLGGFKGGPVQWTEVSVSA